MSYPQGETAFAWASSFWASRAVKNLPYSQALVASSSRLGTCPSCAADLKRLNTGPARQCKRYHSRTTYGVKSASGKVVNTITYSANLKVCRPTSTPFFDASRRIFPCAIPIAASDLRMAQTRPRTAAAESLPVIAFHDAAGPGRRGDGFKQVEAPSARASKGKGPRVDPHEDVPAVRAALARLPLAMLRILPGTVKNPAVCAGWQCRARPFDRKGHAGSPSRQDTAHGRTAMLRRIVVQSRVQEFAPESICDFATARAFKVERAGLSLIDQFGGASRKCDLDADERIAADLGLELQAVRDALTVLGKGGGSEASGDLHPGFFQSGPARSCAKPKWAWFR